jgi:serine/threonine-protein kinase
MSEVDSGDWERISGHLDHLLDLPESERATYLSALMQDQPAVAERLRKLLNIGSQQNFPDFLADTPALVIQSVGEQHLTGRLVGPYVIDGEIGQGGMGSVWRAHRADGRYEGSVAIKFLHPAWLGRHGEQRFVLEGQLLARLNHPSIARLIDAGVLDGGQPYLVLEFVNGEPIDAYCNHNTLRSEARIQLFLRVLEAVGHAHSRLIVHRDLKPSNILVTPDGAVKLLDFGIAKLLQAGAPDLTQSSAHALTPYYAAPEQLNGHDITTATDIYALGLVLYVLLTGKHPLPAKSGSNVSGMNAELIRAILTEDPPRPSTVAEGPPSLRRYLQGDLENILAKALKKAPAERYASIDAFADDLRRFLAHEPIQAHRDTLGYRTAKFVRRHRGSVLTAISIAIALILTTGIAVWQMQIARHERDLARLEARRADATGDFMSKLMGDFGAAMPTQSLRQQLDRARTLLERQHYDDPLVQAELMHYLAGRYAELGDPATRAEILQNMLPLLRRADDAVGYAQVHCWLADAYDDLGRTDESNRWIQEALALIDQLGSRMRPELRADCRKVESYVATSRGENRRAIAAATAAVSEIEGAGLRKGLQHLTLLNAVARAQARAGHYGPAVEILKHLLSEDQQQGLDQSLTGWRHALNEAVDLLAGGRVLESSARIQQLADWGHRLENGNTVQRDLADVQGRMLVALGRPSEAVALLRSSAQDAAEKQDIDAALEASTSLIEALLATGNLDAARQELTKFNDAAVAAFTARKQQGLLAMRAAALVDLADGHANRAMERLREAATAAIDADGLPTPAMRLIAITQSDVALSNNQPEQACAAAETALRQARSEAVNPDSSAWIGQALLFRSRCKLGAHHPDEAKLDAAAALPHLVANLGESHALTKMARTIAVSGRAGAP